jgi:hypothetical protein
VIWRRPLCALVLIAGLVFIVEDVWEGRWLGLALLAAVAAAALWVDVGAAKRRL